MIYKQLLLHVKIVFQDDFINSICSKVGVWTTFLNFINPTQTSSIYFDFAFFIVAQICYFLSHSSPFVCFDFVSLLLIFIYYYMLFSNNVRSIGLNNSLRLLADMLTPFVKLILKSTSSLLSGRRILMCLQTCIYF